jgi:hypothetical protein
MIKKLLLLIMKKMKIKVLLVIFSFSIIGHSQTRKDSLLKTYEFNIYDGSESFTMNQFNSLTTSLGFDIWNQPSDLSFTTYQGKIGGNGFLKINYSAFQSESYFVKNIGLFSGIFYKSKGFLPNYASLESDFGIRFGLSFSY